MKCGREQVHWVVEDGNLRTWLIFHDIYPEIVIVWPVFAIILLYLPSALIVPLATLVTMREIVYLKTVIYQILVSISFFNVFR